MIRHTEYEQNSVEWSLARSGIPTASEFDALVTPKWAIRQGEMPKTYLAKKLAEKWQGGPLASFMSFDMDQGKTLEEEAIPWFAFEYDQPVERVAFITNDDGRIGCSPDGMLTTKAGLNGGLEIKCPLPETQVKRLLNGVLPDDYAAQIQGSMFVTGLEWWQFLSYRRHFPAFLLRVERDEKAQAAIAQALADFLGEFDACFKRLCEINGGPPLRKKQDPQVPLEPADDLSYSKVDLQP